MAWAAAVAARLLSGRSTNASSWVGAVQLGLRLSANGTDPVILNGYAASDGLGTWLPEGLASSVPSEADGDSCVQLLIGSGAWRLDGSCADRLPFACKRLAILPPQRPAMLRAAAVLTGQAAWAFASRQQQPHPLAARGGGAAAVLAYVGPFNGLAEAEALCEDVGGSVAQLRTLSDWEELVRLMGAAVLPPHLASSSGSNVSLVFLLGATQALAGSEPGFRNLDGSRVAGAWGAGQPDGAATGGSAISSAQSCLALRAEFNTSGALLAARLQDEDCGADMGVICQVRDSDVQLLPASVSQRVGGSGGDQSHSQQSRDDTPAFLTHGRLHAVNGRGAEWLEELTLLYGTAGGVQTKVQHGSSNAAYPSPEPWLVRSEEGDTVVALRGCTRAAGDYIKGLQLVTRTGRSSLWFGRACSGGDPAFALTAPAPGAYLAALQSLSAPYIVQISIVWAIGGGTLTSAPAWSAAGVRHWPYPSLKLPWPSAHAWCSARHAGHLASLPTQADNEAAAGLLAPVLAFGLRRAGDGDGASQFAWASGGAPETDDPRLPDASAWPVGADCGVWFTFNNTWGLASCNGTRENWLLEQAVMAGGALCSSPDGSETAASSPPLLPYSLPFRGLELLLFPYGATFNTSTADTWPSAYGTALATCASYGAELLRLPATDLPLLASLLTDTDATRSAAATASPLATVSGSGAMAALGEGNALLSALAADLQRLPLGSRVAGAGLLVTLQALPDAATVLVSTEAADATLVVQPSPGTDSTSAANATGSGGASFPGSAAACAVLGGELLSLSRPEELEQLAAVLGEGEAGADQEGAEPVPSSLWLGLHDLITPGLLQWLGGQEAGAVLLAGAASASTSAWVAPASIAAAATTTSPPFHATVTPSPIPASPFASPSALIAP
ncbi:hypothetical protein GPECTOR_7g1317 [Gonium pectorale]|uniref:C-type lectin domain-containing protein n=1 Tax=Gonium pectorale TaxID=33097 RepID=A0A150GUA4_GONPE|nr:hypothetical protein GPECTOR_7g1317 [Gonium pectorale]|eukprot:KXZ53419.1 hypothetical protein GPECTOR_7g1317 [Gonium pectorale]